MFRQMNKLPIHNEENPEPHLQVIRSPKLSEKSLSALL